MKAKTPAGLAFRPDRDIRFPDRGGLTLELLCNKDSRQAINKFMPVAPNVKHIFSAGLPISSTRVPAGRTCASQCEPDRVERVVSSPGAAVAAQKGPCHKSVLRRRISLRALYRRTTGKLGVL